MNDAIAGYLAMERATYAQLVAQSDYTSEAFTADDRAEHVVGYYAQHEAYDYERWLFGGTDIAPQAVALDWGCGPARMILRLAPLFARIDGIDISPEVLEIAKRRTARLPVRPRLAVTDGQSLPAGFENAYDVAYSVISLQHVCVHSVRRRILESLFRALKPGGLLTFQMGYGPGHVARVEYGRDHTAAASTNGASDVTVLHPAEIAADLAAAGFVNAAYALTPTGPGDVHAAWIFVRAMKPGPSDAAVHVDPARWAGAGFHPLAPDPDAVRRAHECHHNPFTLFSYCHALEQRIRDLEGFSNTLEQARAVGRDLERQLGRIRRADIPRVRALMDGVVSDAAARGLGVGVFGAGAHTEWLLAHTNLGAAPGLTVFDNSPEKWGTTIGGAPVRPPADIPGQQLAAVVVSSLAFQDAIASSLEPLVAPGTAIVCCYPPDTTGGS